MTRNPFNPFDGLFSDGPATRPPAAKPEKGVQIRGRRLDTGYYVRADDIVALLKANDVLPGIAAKLQKAADQ